MNNLHAIFLLVVFLIFSKLAIASTSSVQNCDANCAHRAYPYAILSESVYNNNAPVFIKDTTKLYSWTTINTYKGNQLCNNYGIKDISCRSNGLTARLYKNDRTNNYILAFRGTDTKNPISLAEDLAEDLDAFEIYNWQYKLADLLTDDVLKLYGDKLTLTGHSLGGALAMRSGWTHGLVVYAFNPGRVSAGNTVKASKLNIFRLRDSITGTKELLWHLFEKSNFPSDSDFGDFYIITYPASL